jgi:hypothetical protein
MDEHDGDQGTEQQDQDLDPERPAVTGLSTGDARVDAAVAGLSRLRGTPAEDHVAILEEVHGRLRDILGELGEDQGTPEHPEGQP